MTKKIRIAHVFLTLDIGGMEKVGADLIENIDPEQFENFVICLEALGSNADQLKSHGFEVVCLFKRKGFQPSVVFQLVSYFKKKKIDVVHTNNAGPHFWAGVAAYLCGIKIRIHTDHSRNIGWSARRIWLDQMCSKLSTIVVGVSKDVSRRLIMDDKVNPIKVKTIFNGIDTEVFSPASRNETIREELGVKKEDVLIGCVARFRRDKDQHTLIRAFSRLHANHKNVKLLLIGDGETRAELVSLVQELNLTHEVIFGGLRKDVPDLMRSIEIFVLSSHMEGLPISLLEAMSSRLPVIATRVGGNPEIITNDVNGFLTNENDFEDLAVRLHLLVEDNELRVRLAFQARETVVTDFSFKNMVQKYQQLYLGNE